jgi:hypothetical protein
MDLAVVEWLAIRVFLVERVHSLFFGVGPDAHLGSSWAGYVIVMKEGSCAKEVVHIAITGGAAGVDLFLAIGHAAFKSWLHGGENVARFKRAAIQLRI